MSVDNRGGILTHPAAIALSVLVWVGSLVYTGWRARGTESAITTAIAVLQSKIDGMEKHLDRIDDRLDGKARAR